MSRKNGLQHLSEPIWQTVATDPLIERPALIAGEIIFVNILEDMGTAQMYSVGESGNFQITVAARVVSRTNDTPVILRCVALSPAVYGVDLSTFSSTNFLMTSATTYQVLESTAAPGVGFQTDSHAPSYGDALHGGSAKSFFQGIWNGIKTAGKWIGDHISTIAPIVIKGAEMLGAGEEGGSSRGVKRIRLG
jgi:hypothetical protein